MRHTLRAGEVLMIEADTDAPTYVGNGGPGIVYYGTSSVSSTSNVGELGDGDDVVLLTTRWVVSASRSELEITFGSESGSPPASGSPYARLDQALILLVEGAPTDADFTIAPEAGQQALDTDTNLLYTRLEDGSWVTVEGTGPQGPGGTVGSEVYASAYGVASDTADNSIGINSAIAAAAAAADAAGAFFGYVRLPPGNLACLGSILLRDPDTGTWVILEGAGIDTTVLIFPTDLGDGVYALEGTTGTPPGRYTLREFTVFGPGTGQPLGVSPADMAGIRLPYGGKAVRVRSERFKYGITFVNDHNSAEHCKCAENLYGIYYTSPVGARGNNSTSYCKLDGNCRASIGIGPDGGMEGDYHAQTHFGFGPYGIWAETGAYSVSLTSQFDSCAWESCGNAAIATEDGASRFDGNVLTNCFGLGLDTNFNIEGESTDWYIRDLSSFNGNRIISGTIGAGVGDEGWLDVSQCLGNDIEGEVPAGYQQVSAATSIWSGRPSNTFRMENGAIGFLHTASGAVTESTLLQYGPVAYGGFVSTNPASESGKVAGVARDDAADGEHVVVVKQGPQEIKASEDNSSDAGPVAVSTATDGYVKNASGTDRVIGTYYNSFGSAPRVFVVQLQGLA